MSYGIENAEMIKSHRVFLDLENPRVPVPFQDEDEAIAWLCDNEDVLTLARDIHDIGPNPKSYSASRSKIVLPFRFG